MQPSPIIALCHLKEHMSVSHIDLIFETYNGKIKMHVLGKYPFVQNICSALHPTSSLFSFLNEPLVQNQRKSALYIGHFLLALS